jgi:hypothetical protein
MQNCAVMYRQYFPTSVLLLVAVSFQGKRMLLPILSRFYTMLSVRLAPIERPGLTTEEPHKNCRASPLTRPRSDGA